MNVSSTIYNIYSDQESSSTLVFKIKGQPVLLFPSFVHNHSINERKNMKLREDICYEMIN